jgi:hypothetical protein
MSIIFKSITTSISGIKDRREFVTSKERLIINKKDFIISKREYIIVYKD